MDEYNPCDVSLCAVYCFCLAFVRPDNFQSTEIFPLSTRIQSDFSRLILKLPLAYLIISRSRTDRHSHQNNFPFRLYNSASWHYFKCEIKKPVQHHQHLRVYLHCIEDYSDPLFLILMLDYLIYFIDSKWESRKKWDHQQREFSFSLICCCVLDEEDHVSSDAVGDAWVRPLLILVTCSC